MKNIVRKSHKTGLPPGALIHVGVLKSNTSIVTVCGYDNDLFWEEKTDDLKKCLTLFERLAKSLIALKNRCLVL